MGNYKVIEEDKSGPLVIQWITIFGDTLGYWRREGQWRGDKKTWFFRERP